jgi:hypothetical protein
MDNPNKKTDIIPCPNVKVCGNYGQDILFSCYHGRCRNCDVFLGEWHGGKGNLEFKIIDDCCICFEEKLEGVSMPKCKHYICVECFKKCFNLTEQPFYPEELYDYTDELNDIENEFPDDSEHTHYIILAKRYPEIAEITMIYTNGCEKWWEIYNKNEDNEKNLRRCPLCRK